MSRSERANEDRSSQDRIEELAAQAIQLQEQATEMKALNDALLKSEARLRSLVDSSLDAIVTADQYSVITSWNRHAERIFGWTADEAIGKRLTETIIPPEYRGMHDRGVEKYLATGEGPILNRRVEIKGVRRDGSEVPVELTVAPAEWGTGEVIMSAFIRDISERVEARRRQEAERAKALRAMEAVAADLRVERSRLREIFDMAPALISVTRGPEHIFELTNAAYRLMVNHRELEGKTIREALPELAGQGFFETRDEVYATGEPLIRSEAPVVADLDGDGKVEEYFLNFLTQPLRNAQGDVEAILTFAVDVSEQVRSRSKMEEQAAELEAHTEELQTQAIELQEVQATLEETNEQLQSANVAKSDFLATMSHELRTPLNAMVGYTDLLLSGVPEPIPDSAAKQVERISLSAHHLRELIEEILAFSRMEAGREKVDIVTADVDEILSEVGSIIEPLANERPIDFSIEGPERPISLETDPHKVRQVLINLIGNALKFTESGSVTVTVEADDDWVRFPIRDTGIGIDEENLERIFESFWQADSSHTRAVGGTGLGLGVSQRFAELLGGRVTVKSVPGEGSTFTLMLPRH